MLKLIHAQGGSMGAEGIPQWGPSQSPKQFSTMNEKEEEEKKEEEKKREGKNNRKMSPSYIPTLDPVAYSNGNVCCSTIL